MSNEQSQSNCGPSRCSHTPGPWRASNVISAYEMKRRKIVADEQSPEAGTGICEVYGVEDGSNIANATLIAAAPELLHACELLLMLSLPRDVSGMAMVKIARRAVRKARGLDEAV